MKLFFLIFFFTTTFSLAADEWDFCKYANRIKKPMDQRECGMSITGFSNHVAAQITSMQGHGNKSVSCGAFTKSFRKYELEIAANKSLCDSVQINAKNALKATEGTVSQDKLIASGIKAQEQLRNHEICLSKWVSMKSEISLDLQKIVREIRVAKSLDAEKAKAQAELSSIKNQGMREPCVACVQSAVESQRLLIDYQEGLKKQFEYLKKTVDAEYIKNTK